MTEGQGHAGGGEDMDRGSGLGGQHMIPQGEKQLPGETMFGDSQVCR